MVVVEACFGLDFYLWFWFVEREGTNNELNVLGVSPLIQSILRGDLKFEVGHEFKLSDNGPTRRQLYFLGDEIYPNWPIIAKPIHETTI